MKENLDASLPTAIYGAVLLLCGLAYYVLERALIRLHGSASVLARALGADRKTQVSVVVYALAIALAFVHAYIADALYVAVAILWLVPDRRIERGFVSKPGPC
jgi:uncharacterized membrane protein